MPTAAAVWVAWAAWRCDGCASANPNAASTRTPIRGPVQIGSPALCGASCLRGSVGGHGIVNLRAHSIPHKRSGSASEVGGWRNQGMRLRLADWRSISQA